MKTQTQRIVTMRTVPWGETVFFPDGTFNSTADMLTINTRWWTQSDWQEFFQTPADERLSLAREIDRAHALINPSNYEGAIPIIGVKCGIVYHDDDPASVQPVYISFSEEFLNHMGETAEEDIYGVPDKKIFCYLNKEEVESLTSAILNEENYWSMADNSEWYVDLTEGYTAITDMSEV